MSVYVCGWGGGGGGEGEHVCGVVSVCVCGDMSVGLN